ncbi:MAG: thioredoxin domain-containing protein [Acidimicrobiia bacterium]|nr:thioredoxin domain-containing protein [Acidimicrobiia bacterium]MDH5238098.1 thioredoxin domain-containing protein [Acidimicrobiia bacterium]
MNRLASQTSPYLRQHADNPVDWHPWGEEAFQRAQAEDKPILLSIGYSACHWCHVMAHESFEDEATARVMNERFINIKVDREERPDVDAIYMDAVQAMSGRGGWPMTAFLLPTGEPFFGGTYFPKEARHGMTSFMELMDRVQQAWADQRDGLVDQASRLTGQLGRLSSLEPGTDLPGASVLVDAAAQLQAQHDPVYGGFGTAPKFPPAMTLDALLRHYTHTGEPEVLDVVTTTLDAMASGGIYDHLGGGFSRYSVDEEWVVPHFEKMLYDNALLIRTYLHAWLVTGEQRHLQVVEETIDYLHRDLRHPDGGFYSAEDADSEGVEGKFYVFSPDDLRAVLGDRADAAIEWYGVTERGNFEGRNILLRPVRGDLIRPPEIDAIRTDLRRWRDQRVRPGLDDKVLTEWNALLLGALAEAAAATGRPDWLDQARRTATFLVDELRRDDGRWMRSWQAEADGAQHLAYAADYAALVDAFTRLAEATGEARWIDEARQCADGLIQLFWDDAHGGVFTTGADAEPLITRPKDLMDNATPSANSLTAVGLLRLAALTGIEHYRDRAEDTLRLIGDLARQHPAAFGHALAAIDMAATDLTEIAIVGDAPELVDAVQRRFTPNAVLAWGEPYDSPLWVDRADGHAYVCRDYACQAPVTTTEALLAQLA